MTLHLYTALRAWRQARSERKHAHAASEAPVPPLAERPADAEAVIYAAGIACASQVNERPRR